MFQWASDLKKNENIITIFGDDYLYVRGFSGNLSSMVNELESWSNLILRAKYSNENALPTLSLFTADACPHSSKSDQTLIVPVPSGCKSMSNEVRIEPIYYSLSAIMRDIKRSYDPRLEVEAVVRLLKARRKTNLEDIQINKLLLLVQKHSLEHDFNLDALCEKVFMSRRKVQYLFKSNGLCFREVLGRNRLLNMMELILKKPNFQLEQLAINSGFSTLYSANRMTKKVKGVDLRTYRNMVKASLSSE